MSWVFVLFVVCASVTALGWMTARRSDDRQVRRGGQSIAVSGTAVSLVLLGLSSLTMVGTKAVGVVTWFGRPVDTLPNGLHVVAPWSRVVQLRGDIQTDNHVGSGGGSSCTTVRLAAQSTACVDNSVRWRIRPRAAEALFRDYRDFDRVRDSLVTRELGAALNEVFATYDPLAGLAGAGPDAGQQTLAQLSAQVTQRLADRVGDRVEVMNVIIPLVRFDASTEERIQRFQVALADTRIAEQRKATATAEAAANTILSASVRQDPNVLVSKCLDILAQMAKDKVDLPAGGVNCFGGTPPVLVSAR